jgi:transcriptional regulator with XRE-family HTH domain
MTVDFRGLQERLREQILAQIAAGELTGLQLAQQTGFRQAHISNFLNRKRGLSLEAMDAILRAQDLTIDRLLAPNAHSSTRIRSLQANAPGLTYIPLVDASECLAREVPYSARQNVLSSLLSRLEKLPVRARIPRPHWTRFVALRVPKSDAVAMAPRLTTGSVAIIDRHSNAPDGESIYLAQATKQSVLRYVEEVDGRFVLRAENSKSRLLQPKTEKRADPLAAIVGRVCALIAEM